MIPLKRYKTEFWGQPCTARPYLVERVFGDGKELLWLEYMDDRPDFYVIRIPTGTHAGRKGDDCDFQDNLLPEIESTIEEEASWRMSDAAVMEYSLEGYVSRHRHWPIPPHMPSGSAWGEYTGSLILRGGKFICESRKNS